MIPQQAFLQRTLKRGSGNMPPLRGAMNGSAPATRTAIEMTFKRTLAALAALCAATPTVGSDDPYPSTYQPPPSVFHFFLLCLVLELEGVEGKTH